ncbi:hypothetical protein AHAS_Ahas05G0128700 [Arachis hypogaea]
MLLTYVNQGILVYRQVSQPCPPSYGCRFWRTLIVAEGCHGTLRYYCTPIICCASLSGVIRQILSGAFC